MVLRNNRNIFFTVLTNICRVVLAVVLVLSGFVKAVDPKGTMYKLMEYAEAFSVDSVSDDWMLVSAALLALAEFLVGVYLLMGVYRKFVAFVVFVIFLFFTPFTLYVLVADPVADCGCFGDAVTMSNEVSFIKNLFLFVLATIVFLGRRRFMCNVSSKNRWMVVLFSIFYISLVEGISLSAIPVVDFRHYAVGNNLRELVQGTPDSYKLLHVYEKDGVMHEFGQDSLPDDSWKLVETRSVIVAEGRRPVVGDFAILDWENDYDVAEEILADTGYVFMLVVENVNEASVGRIDKINDLYDYCLENSLPFYAATASNEDDINLWRKRTGAEYPIYWADNMLLRTIVRANPGILLVKDGMIVGKWNVKNMPATSDMVGADTAGREEKNYIGRMKGLRFWMLSLALPLIFIALLDLATGRKKKTDTDEDDLSEISERENM